MKSAAIARLESLLTARKLADTFLPDWANEPRVGVSSGVSGLDALLGGGWPRGEISEVLGARSSGRTSVLVSTMARATREGAVVALVDTCDRFDPRRAMLAGLDCRRVLWVRGPAVMVESARPSLVEQTVRQAIRAFDLVLRAGGFAVVALDLADVPTRALRALPHSTWLRLAHVNEGRETAGVLIGEEPMGRSARGASIRLEATTRWRGACHLGREFDGFQIHPSHLNRRVPFGGRLSTSHVLLPGS